jgi:hypothetical protein
MRRLILAGMPPASAAQRATELNDVLGEQELLTSHESFVANTQLVDFLLKTANALDGNTFSQYLNRELDQSSVEVVYETIIIPLLQRLGEIWESSGDGVAVEHLVSDLVIRALSDVTVTPTRPINSRPVLLACVENEPHSIPLYALGAALSQRNISFISLGAKTPRVALAEVVKKFAPPVIFLWAQQSRLGSKGFCSELPAVRPAPKIIVAGPGWDPESTVGNVYASSFSQACDEISSTFTL